MTVQLVGTLSAFSHIDELINPTGISIVRTGAQVLPTIIKPQWLQSQGPNGDAFESRLVQVRDVYTARLVEPPGTGANDDDFYVSNDPGETCEGENPPCTRIDDFLFDGGDSSNDVPATTLGQHYESITGVVTGFFDNYFLQFLSEADLVEAE